MTSKNKVMKRVNRELWIEVEVENEGNGYCTISPVNGKGSIRVMTSKVKLVH